MDDYVKESDPCMHSCMVVQIYLPVNVPEHLLHVNITGGVNICA